MKRRDFFRLTGTTASGIALSSFVTSLHAGEPENTIFLPFIAGQEGPSATTQYNIYASSTGNLELTIPTGINFGSASADLFKPLLEPALAIAASEDACLEICSNTPQLTLSEVNEKLTFVSLVNSFPSTLIPLMLHPINTIRDIEEQSFALDLGIMPRIIDGDNIQEVLPLDEQSVNSANLNDALNGINVGNYFVRMSYEKHYLGGCIKRDVWHAGALVKYWPTDRMIFDLHIASWWSSGGPCVGVYESKSGWCRATCTSDIWKGIYTLVLAAALIYVSYWIAQAIAAAVATAALGILVAIPGVPPPP